MIVDLFSFDLALRKDITAKIFEDGMRYFEAYVIYMFFLLSVNT